MPRRGSLRGEVLQRDDPLDEAPVEALDLTVQRVKVLAVALAGSDPCRHLWRRAAASIAVSTSSGSNGEAAYRDAEALDLTLEEEDVILHGLGVS